MLSKSHVVDCSSYYLWDKSSNAWKGFSKQAFVKGFGMTLGLAGQHLPPCCSPVATLPQGGNSLCCFCWNTINPVVITTVWEMCSVLYAWAHCDPAASRHISMDGSCIVLCSTCIKLSSKKPFHKPTSALLDHLSHGKKAHYCPPSIYSWFNRLLWGMRIFLIPF